MLPVRHIRIWSSIAELCLAALLVVNQASAQAAASQATPTTSAAAPTAPAASQATPTTPAAAPTAPAASQATPTTTTPGSQTASASPSALHDAAAVAGSTAEESDQDATLPESDRVVSKPPSSVRWLLLGTGAATTGLFYLGGLGIGQIWPDAPGKPDLKYPIAGPIMDLAHTGCPSNDSDCSKFQLALRTIMISIDALGQAGGLALMLQGAVLGTASVDAPRSLPNAKLRRGSEPMTVVAVPWVDGRSGGLSLTGRF